MIHHPENSEAVEIDDLRVRTQSAFFGAEEVGSDLLVAESAHVRGVAVDAATGFGELEDVDCVGVEGGGGEAAGHVAVEAFGAEDKEDVDWGWWSAANDQRKVALGYPFESLQTMLEIGKDQYTTH